MTKRISMVLCLFVVACGGADSEPAAEPITYENMSFEQREAFMAEVVMPQMKEVFVAFDPKYEAFSCATCHGKGATDGTYALPNADILPLPATEEAFFAKLEQDPEFARWSQFMLDKVYPQMAEMLQVPMFDPMKQPDGFSCSNCHTHE
mgnify:CR=1 FL=1